MNTPLTSLQSLLRAAAFAAEKHRSQRRKDDEASPYVNHCLRVAELAAAVGGIDDLDVLVAALLHDTLEDTETTSDELEQAFGDRVRALVESVTDDKSLEKAERKRLQVAHAHELPADAVPIKLADKIANVEDIAASPPRDWPMQRRVEYLDWAEAVVDHCPRVNRALEDAFRRTLARARQAIAQT